MTKRQGECIELGGDNLLDGWSEIIRRISRFCNEMDNFWMAMNEARLADMLARKYIKMERRRLKELVKIILSRVTYIRVVYNLLIRGYRRAKGWRITGEE